MNLLKALETYRIIDNQLQDNWLLYMSAHDNRAKKPQMESVIPKGFAYLHPIVKKVRLDYGFQRLIDLRAISKAQILQAFPTDKMIWLVDLYRVLKDNDRVVVELGHAIPVNRRYHCIFDSLQTVKGSSPSWDEFYWVNSLCYWRKPQTLEEVICGVLSLLK